MKAQTKLETAIKNRFSEVTGRTFEQDMNKTLSMRLDIQDYARLKALAVRLQESPSNMGKIILVSALDDAIETFLQSGGDNTEDVSLDFAEQCDEILRDLI